MDIDKEYAFFVMIQQTAETSKCMLSCYLCPPHPMPLVAVMCFKNHGRVCKVPELTYQVITLFTFHALK